MDKSRQLNILNTVEKNSLPLDLFSRSFAQYKSQMYLTSSINKLFLNCSSIFILPIFLCISVINYLKFKKKKSNLIPSNIAIFFGVYRDTIPESLKKYNIYNGINNYILNQDSLRYLFHNIYMKYWSHPYFCLKLAVKIGIYNYNIMYFKPKCIIATSEYSFTSSILTHFCEKQNCLHINVMHGEKSFDINNSFFRFHQCFVWHEHYIKLFSELKADQTQFIVELPRKFLYTEGSSTKQKNNSKLVLKYYLGGENKELLNILAKTLNVLASKYQIVIRLHPRYSDINEIKHVFGDNIHIEDPNSLTIIESLMCTDYIAALYSTVLFEAYCLNKKIIINDLDQLVYKKMIELDFMVVQLEHQRLSEFI